MPDEKKMRPETPLVTRLAGNGEVQGNTAHKKATNITHPRRYSLDQEPIDVSAESMDPIIDAIEDHYQKSDRFFNTAANNNSAADESAVSGGPEITELHRHEGRPCQPQQQPGAVNIRGVNDTNESDEEEQGKYDNLNDAFSAEFRRTSIVKAQVVSQDTLEQEFLERVQQGSIVVQGSSLRAIGERYGDGSGGLEGDSGNTIDMASLKKDSKCGQTSWWRRVGIPVWIIIVIALVGGGLAGGILGSRRSNSEVPLSPSLVISMSPSSSPSSLSPTAAPSPYVREELLELYSIVQIQPHHPFPYNTSSYSYQALEWVQGQREKFPNLTRQEIIYKYVGACIGFAINAPEVFTWEFLATIGFFTDQPVCEWFGITCANEDEGSETNSTTTNSTGNLVIVSIWTDAYDLKGVIPAELALLSNSLTEITYTGTRAFGTIATELGLLTKLQLLNLSYNDLTGEIPSEMGLLTQLRRLDLTGNTFTGTLPTELSKIGSSFEEISLAENRLRLDFDPRYFTSMTNLQVLRGDGSEFGVPLMSEIGLLTKLRVLSASQCNLGSTLPSEIGRLTDLEELNVGKNTHTGSLPSEMGLLTSLERLYLERNSFTGTIPSSMFDQLSNLTVFDLSGNQLSGSLPSSLRLLTSLKELYVGRNNFVGSNPVCETENTTTAAWQDGGIVMADCSELNCSCCTHCCEALPVCLRVAITDP